MMYVNQIIMLYILNLYSAVSQLYLNKTGRKKRGPRELLLPSATWGHSNEKTMSMNQEVGPHKTPIPQPLHLGLSSLQKVRNKCLLLKPPVCGIFVIAAQKD